MNTLALGLAFAAIVALASGNPTMAKGLALVGLLVTGAGFIWRTDRRPPYWKYDGLRRK